MYSTVASFVGGGGGGGMTVSGVSNLRHFGIASTSGRKWNLKEILHQQGRRAFTSYPATTVKNSLQRENEKLLVVVGGGAAGIYAAIRAKTLAPFLDVVVVEKGKPLSKVKISGGGRCNVTNGHCLEKMDLANHCPRGNKELKGSFFDFHGPVDTMSWFHRHGVELKTEEDGRVFPISNSSASIVDCLLHEAKRNGVSSSITRPLQFQEDVGSFAGLYYFGMVYLHKKSDVGKVVTDATCNTNGKFLVKIEKRSVDSKEILEADYLLLATGSSRQGYALGVQLGHSIVDPMPSLFTFKIEDTQLTALSGITFPKVNAKLKLAAAKSIPQFTQVGAILVTHWGLSGPVILRLSAWSARDLFLSNYTGTLFVDFLPDVPAEEVKRILFEHRSHNAKHKVMNSFPPNFGIVKRFWRYLLQREGLNGDILWASISNNSLTAMASLLKQCNFKINGKGQFKDEFVTAGGIPLSEVSLKTMESRKQAHLFFAGEILNVDGVTGGFNFQNAWSGGYIAGTSIGELASRVHFHLQTDPGNYEDIGKEIF